MEMKDYKAQIRAYLGHEVETIQRLDVNEINRALNLLQETFENGSTVYIFGNGGSSSTASHYQNDFNKGVSEHTRKKFNFQCLNDNVATVMAVANDIGFEFPLPFSAEGAFKARRCGDRDFRKREFKERIERRRIRAGAGEPDYWPDWI